MDSTILQALRQVLAETMGEDIPLPRPEPVGGGSINQTYRLWVGPDSSYFCKMNDMATFPGLFEKEKHGLERLAAVGTMRVPGVIACDSLSDKQFLLLEWIESGTRSENFWKRFGESLAMLHQASHPFFGLEEDNYMGALPQSNRPHRSWCEFLIEERFEPQLALAIRAQLIEPHHARQFEQLYQKLDDIFPVTAPSLLHGDLWSGNFLCDANGNATLIDPAVYFGHPAMDLGMTGMFGGFDPAFYEAYHYYSPLPSNYREQWEVCRLYPLLIHLNLFGKSYLPDILHTIQSC